MKQLTITIDDFLYDFYRKIGNNVGKTPEKTIEDALFRLAGELAMEAISKKEKSACIVRGVRAGRVVGPYNGLSYPLRLPPTKREPCGSLFSSFYLLFFRQRSSSGNRASRFSSVTVSTVTCGCRAMRWRNSLSACCKTPRMGISPSSARNTAA